MRAWQDVEADFGHPFPEKFRVGFKAIAQLNLTDASGQGTRIDDFLLARLVAEDAHLPFYKIDALKLNLQFIETKISRPFARKHQMIPLQMRDGKLIVALVNPFDVPALESYKSIAQSELANGSEA